MREDEVLKMIKDSADHVVIPESLEPENMMKKLQAIETEPEAELGAADAPGGRKNGSGKKGPHRYWKYGTVAAAALVLVSLLTVGRGQLPGIESGVLPAGTEAATETQAGEQAAGPEGALAAAEAAGAEQYQAKSHDEVYDRFQELREEEERRYEEMYGNHDRGGSIFEKWFGGRTYATEDIMEEAVVAETEAAMDGGMAGSAQSNGVQAPAAAPGAVRQSEMGDLKKEIAFEAESDQMALGGIADDAYSGTNIQVEGVDEGDVVKTDGTYIYVSSNDMGTIRIIRPDGTKMEKVGVIPDSSTVGSSRRIEEFYLNGNLMTVIRSSYETENTEPGTQSRTADDSAVYDVKMDIAYCYPYMPGKSVTRVETYDLTKPAEPKLTGTVVQDGYYKSSRRSGDYVYVFTGYDSDVSAGREEKEKYIPRVNGKVIPADSIFIPEKIETYSYLVVSSVDMREPGDTVQTKAVTASGEQYYVSSDNIYIASSKYDYRANQYNYTELMKFSYRDGRISFVGHGNVNGYLNNQFSMDEYKGNLRLVSTLSRNNGKNTNSLYVLNEKLEKIGEIEDLAPDEQIYSARFMGEIGYFVTFRNMDPLFSVDLTDPANPKILGELKITGFSEYLHPYADGLLLGIGQEIDPETANFEGLKLSMFDTSNPKNVTETQKIVEKSFEHSPAWGNHKSVLVSPTRNLIGFTAESYDYDNRDWRVVYAVYSYDKKNGFKQELCADLDESNDYYMTRGLYIGDWLYVVENNRINAYSLKDFTHGNELTY